MIRLDAISKRYPNGQLAVRELSLDVPDGEICVLVGPSGCGKTTTLKMINRLIEPTSGRIFLDGNDVTHADPVELRRHIGYVIQQVGLFPHQTSPPTSRPSPACSVGRRAASARASTSCSTSWGSTRPTTGRGIPRSCPAGSASGSASRARWPPTLPSS